MENNIPRKNKNIPTWNVLFDVFCLPIFDNFK